MAGVGRVQNSAHEYMDEAGECPGPPCPPEPGWWMGRPSAWKQQAQISPHSPNQCCPTSGCPWRGTQLWDTSGWILQRGQCQLHLRSYNHHEAVAEHADPNHEIRHWQPVFQPANCPLVVVVAIKECWVFDVALQVKQKQSCVNCAAFLLQESGF